MLPGQTDWTRREYSNQWAQICVSLVQCCACSTLWKAIVSIPAYWLHPACPAGWPASFSLFFTNQQKQKVYSRKIEITDFVRYWVRLIDVEHQNKYHLYSHQEPSLAAESTVVYTDKGSDILGDLRPGFCSSIPWKLHDCHTTETCRKKKVTAILILRQALPETAMNKMPAILLWYQQELHWWAWAPCEGVRLGSWDAARQ